VPPIKESSVLRKRELSASCLNPGRPSPHQAANAPQREHPAARNQTDRQRRNLTRPSARDEVVPALGAAVAPMTALGVIGDATGTGAAWPVLTAPREQRSRRKLHEEDVPLPLIQTEDAGQILVLLLLGHRSGPR